MAQSEINSIPMQLRSFFGALPDDLRAHISAAGQARDYPDGARLHSRGDKGRGFSIIEKGAVRFSSVNLEGMTTGLTTLEAGNAFGELSIFAEMPRAYDAEAVGETRIRVIPAAKLDRLMDVIPLLRQHVLRHLACQLSRTLILLNDQQQLSLDKRIAKTLASLTSNDGDHIRITQQALAEDMAVSRVGLSKALNKLIDAGLVETGYRTITVCDHAGLEAYWR